MRNRWHVAVVTVLAAAALVADTGRAAAGSDGLVLRALGFYQGTFEEGKCTVPTAETNFPDAGAEMGLWNTYGFQTISFPDVVNPFAQPCGMFLQLQNAMTFQGINVEKIDVRLRIAGAKQYRQFVPTRKGFPSACQQLRKMRYFTGTRLNPVASDGSGGGTGSGQPNVALTQLLGLVPYSVFNCLRDQYAGLPTTVYSSFPLVIRIVASGRGDNGDSYKSNPIRYALTLRHTCGNGRVDDGEFCDPNAPNTCTVDTCDTERSVCKFSGRPCAGDGDCAGICLPQNDPSECTCVY